MEQINEKKDQRNMKKVKKGVNRKNETIQIKGKQETKTKKN